MSTLFSGGTLFDGHRYLGGGGPRRGWPDRRGPTGGFEAALRLAPSTVVDAACVAPGFVDAHVHPIQGGLERLRCDLSEHEHPRGLPRRDRGVRRRQPGRRVDPRRRLGDAGLPGRHADRGRPRHRRAGPAGVPAQPRPPRRLGQQPRAGDRRHRRAHARTRPTAGSSATPTAARPAPCTRARPRWSSRFLPRTTGEDYYAALMAGQSYLHSLGVTGWQDAIVGAYSGMDDPASTYATAAAERRPALPRRRRAVVGAAARRRAGRRPGRPAGRR